MPSRPISSSDCGSSIEVKAQHLPGRVVERA
jgi:hypothetical protein